MHMSDKKSLKVTRCRDFILICMLNEYRGIKILPAMGLYSMVARYIRNVKNASSNCGCVCFQNINDISMEIFSIYHNNAKYVYKLRKIIIG